MRKISIMGYGLSACVAAALLTAGMAVADAQAGGYPQRATVQDHATIQDAAIAISDPGLWLQYHAPEVLAKVTNPPPVSLVASRGAGGLASGVVPPSRSGYAPAASSCGLPFPGCPDQSMGKFTDLHGAGGWASSRTAAWTADAPASMRGQMVTVPMSKAPEPTDGTPAPADFRTTPMTLLDWAIFAFVGVLVVGFIAGVENLAPINRRGEPLTKGGDYSFGGLGGKAEPPDFIGLDRAEHGHDRSVGRIHRTPARVGMTYRNGQP